MLALQLQLKGYTSQLQTATRRGWSRPCGNAQRALARPACRVALLKPFRGVESGLFSRLVEPSTLDSLAPQGYFSLPHIA